VTPALTVIGVWIAAFLTLTIFSFLFKDNPIYKFAEHLVVGLSAGYWMVVLVQNVFMDLIVNPIKADVLTLSLLFAPVQEGAGKGGNGLLLDLAPIVLGVMMWLRFFPKTSWWSRIPIAYVLGSGAGLAIPTALQTFIVSPLAGTLTLPIVPTGWQAWTTGLFGGGSAALGEPVSIWTALGNLLIVAGVFCGIVYFFFSKEHRGITGKAALWKSLAEGGTRATVDLDELLGRAEAQRATVSLHRDRAASRAFARRS